MEFYFFGCSEENPFTIFANSSNDESSSSIFVESSSSEEFRLSSSSFDMFSSSSEISSSSWPQYSYGELIDKRDGQVYRTIKIGDQTWMAENLNYDDSVSQCYNNELDNCAKYGRLYSWDAAMNCRLFESIGDCYQHHYNNYELGIGSRGICPTGWHIPSNGELSNISALIHKNSNAIKSNYGWNNDKNGYDVLGLNILPAGSYTQNKNSWIDVGESSCFWTTLQSAIALSFKSEKSEVVPQKEAFVYCFSSQNPMIIDYEVPKSNAYSVRCVKDQ